MNEFVFNAPDDLVLEKTPQQRASEVLARSNAMFTELYLRAWIAETGLNPSECELVVQHTPDGSRTFARKREPLPEEP